MGHQFGSGTHHITRSPTRTTTHNHQTTTVTAFAGPRSESRSATESRRPRAAGSRPSSRSPAFVVAIAPIDREAFFPDGRAGLGGGVLAVVPLQRAEPVAEVGVAGKRIAAAVRQEQP